MADTALAPLPIEATPHEINDHSSQYGQHHQWIYRFTNGYGASVIQSKWSYGGEVGCYELAVLQFDGDDHHLTYDTPVTDDVLGWLSIEDVAARLVEIAALP